jgi:predicted DNA-binding protein
MTTQMLIKLDYEMKEKLSFLASKEGESVNSVVRKLIEEYINNKDISSHIDAVWQRIGNSMTLQNISPKDINKAIKAVRRG